MGWLILLFIIGVFILWLTSTSKLADKIKKEFGSNLKKMYHINAIFKIITLKNRDGGYIAFLHDGELFYKKIALMEIQRNVSSDMSMAMGGAARQIASTLMHRAVLKVVLEDGSIIDVDISVNSIPLIQRVQRDIAIHKAEN